MSSSLSLLFPVELETVLLGEDTPASSSPYSAVDGGLFTSIPRMKVLVSFCDESEFGTACIRSKNRSKGETFKVLSMVFSGKMNVFLRKRKKGETFKVFYFLGKKKQRKPESYEVPEEVKLSFREDLRSNPKEEEEGVTETEGFVLRLICFFGKFKPKLRPRSSFSNIIFC